MKVCYTEIPDDQLRYFLMYQDSQHRISKKQINETIIPYHPNIKYM